MRTEETTRPRREDNIKMNLREIGWKGVNGEVPGSSGALL